CTLLEFARSLRVLLYFFHGSGDHRDLHSFPTRRSSDLEAGLAGGRQRGMRGALRQLVGQGGLEGVAGHRLGKDALDAGVAGDHRSEEHTSELQSRENLVCRLLLEKKKNKEYMHD